MGRRKEWADKEEADDWEREEWAAWTVEMRLELGAGSGSGSGTCQGGDTECGSLFGVFPSTRLVALLPPFPLPSPKLELVPQTPRSGGNELDSDGGRARFGGGKARSEGRGRRGRIVN